jgi:NAD(P)-dependent dehydrogenase (short-subunit alcohol dehydrogenase family)
MESKKAIITGGSRGIGRGIALCLAKKGYDVAVSFAAKEDEAKKVVKEIEEVHGRRGFCFKAVLHEKGAGVAYFNQAVEKLGGLDVLVNNAGSTKFESIFELTEETMDYLINLNFRNYFIMTREAARYMAKNGIRGSIINITSSRGERAYPEDGIYGGIKAGHHRAIQSFALDLAPYGIRINNVAPGAIRIRTNEDLVREKHIFPVGFWEKLGDIIPLERSGEPEDIGAAVAFLASDDASYITGITLRVDGGLILPGMPEFPAPGVDDHKWGYSKKTDFPKKGRIQ